jgi:hypothetical protein
MFADHNESNIIPDISCFPPVNTYVFLNFQHIQSQIFENVKFPENEIFTIKLINISIIDSEAFSHSLMLPESSKLSIEIEDLQNSSNIIVKPNAFNRIKIDRLHFFNLNNFNGRSIFDTNCFGNDLHINVLIFEKCGITGFSNIIRKVADVNHLLIRNSPGFTQLTDKSFPQLLVRSKSLEISNTGLHSIEEHTFQAWALILEELILTNNSNLEIFPSAIVDGVLMKLNKLDLSYNPIKFLDLNYDWFPYSYTKHLLLRNQQLDLFLKSNILTTLPKLQRIDFSEGFISDDNNDDLIQKFFPNMSKLSSLDISYTNFTENMIIDLLTIISKTTNHFVDIHLHGHRLTDDNFCSYFTIFKNAPKLLNLVLDETHECNCIIELFYRDKIQETGSSNSVLQPSCLLDSSRQRCDIDAKLSVSNCNIGAQNPDESNAGNNIGKYAFGGIIGGIIVLLLILLSLGFGVAYRIRRRRNTELFMEQPIENPLAAIIEERLNENS